MLRGGTRRLAAKDVRFGAAARQKMLEGVAMAAEAVGATLGPKGRNVAIASEYGDPKITKDGVTVAKALEAECGFANIGVKLVRQACNKTNDIAGDGTTATAVLVHAIYSAGLKCVSRGTNPIDMKRGIDRAVDVVVEELQRHARVVSGPSDVVQVATISANGDTALGALIGEALQRVGKDGVVTTQDGKTLQTELELVEGMSIDRGYVSPYFVTDPKTQKAEFEDAVVLVSAKKLSSVPALLPLLNHVAQSGQPLLIVADDIDGEALTTLIFNRLNGKLRVACVKAPGFGDNKTAMLQDIAVFTGAQVVGDDTGVSLDPKAFDAAILGSAKKVTVEKDKTLLLHGGGSTEVVRERTDLLRQLIEHETSDYNREKLQERLAKLSGGVAVIKVGGASEVEVNEKKDRVTDALCATRAAIQEGLVAGGGSALLHASKALDRLLDDAGLTADQRVGVMIVRDAVRLPVQRIASNAGKEGAVVVEKLLENADPCSGYDALRDKYVNMFEAGIIDPTRVVRASLTDAASVAGLMMTTEAAICDAPKKEGAGPAGGGAGGMGMGGMDY